MSDETKRDESRLPLWARQELNKLRADLAHWRGVAAQVGGQEPTRVVLYDDVPRIYTPMAYLPNNQNIDFLVGDDGYRTRITARLEAREVGARRTHGIYISTNDHPMAIAPVASNVAWVYLGERT